MGLRSNGVVDPTSDTYRISPMAPQHRKLTAPRRIQGKELWQRLGFGNERAFQRARQTGLRGLRLYPIGGQARGVYAREDELEQYLARIARPTMEGGVP